MSSIFGLFTPKHNDQVGINAMLPWNRPYGGDGEAIEEFGNISMGCCIQNLSNTHIQESPVLRYNSRLAVIDAVIYNRDELLSKCECRPDVSDAELVLYLISKNSLSILKDINGDFAGAVYDEETKALTLFRDHMGIRPLYYYADSDVIAFSTDLRGLFAAGPVKGELNDEWIYRTIAGYDSETIDSTPYESARCVTPAHYIDLSFKKDSLEYRSNRYWKLGSKKIKLSSFEEYKKMMRELVEDSVKRRLDAVSGLVGAELSGGLDSGVIDILINRFGRKAEFFSWSIAPDELELADNDERKIISDICKQEKITCNYMHLDSNFTDKVACSMKEAGIEVPDEGSVDFRFALPADSNTYTLLHGSFFVREKGARVMFTGHGGDEGISHRCNAYELFYHHEYYRYLRHMWSVTGKKKRALRTIKRSLKNIYSSVKGSKEAYLNWYASPELLNAEFAASFKGKIQNNVPFGYDPVAYIEGGGSRNRLENMALLGGYSGVRYMVPYLDYRVIDFAVSIPRYLYIHGSTNRYIFREAFKDLLPKSLYVLKNKEETSFNNLKADDDWYDEYSKRKREIIDHLYRNYWNKYLDFSSIDKLYQSGKPSNEEYANELKWEKALLKCALARNLTDRVKKL